MEALPLDVRSDESVKGCVDTVLARAGRLDVLINNAGYVLSGAIEQVTVEEAKAQFETNLFGTMRTVKAALPTLRRQGGGTIINISSIAGLVPGPLFCGIYSATLCQGLLAAGCQCACVLSHGTHVKGLP